MASKGPTASEKLFVLLFGAGAAILIACAVGTIGSALGYFDLEERPMLASVGFGTLLLAAGIASNAVSQTSDKRYEFSIDAIILLLIGIFFLLSARG